MCTNYTPSARDRFAASRLGQVALPQQPWPAETFPGFEAPIVIRSGAPGQPEAAPVAQLARFGLVPRWCKDAIHATTLSRQTYNARQETAFEKPSYRGSWRDQQWALVPMDHYFEPCWENSASHGDRPVRWRISRADGACFAVAALWERWVDPTGGDITSFTLLTVNSDAHPVTNRMHRPGDEKRMPVIIAPDDYLNWLHATPLEAKAFMRCAANDALVGEPAPLIRPARKLEVPNPNLSLF
jgi:putative SOS response-associated peptidase YedK